MQLLLKQIITSLILASFLAVGFFSFATMMHGANERMPGDCPFSAMGASLCPQDTLAIAIHHISAYQSFINMPINSGVIVLILFLLFITSLVLILSLSPFLFRPRVLAGDLCHFPPEISHDVKITRWLSLFENSPSLI